MKLSAGDIIDGKYEVVGILGQGGMGAVYEGRNTRIKRRVAIKVLHAAVAENEEMSARFEREATAPARIGSSHIVDVLDLGDFPTGERYMVMEFLEGGSLKDRMKSAGRMSTVELFPLIIQLLSGLGAAHRAGIIHRDLKPENVHIVDDEKHGGDYLKILDFGVSKFQDDEIGDGFTTKTGMVMGTPYFMSPEQAHGKVALDHRADLYAVGVIIFQALTGRVPFQGKTFSELMFKIALEEAPSMSSLVPDIDNGVEAIVMKAMARDRDERYATAEDFADAVREWLTEAGVTLTLGTMSLTPGGTPSFQAPSHLTGASIHPQRPQSQTLQSSGEATGTLAGVTDTPAGHVPGTSLATPMGNQLSGTLMRPRSKLPVVFGAVVATAVVIGVAAFITQSAVQPQPTPAATNIATAAPASPSVALVETPVAAESSSEPSVASASAATSVSAPPPVAPVMRPPPSPRPTATPPPPPPKTPPPPTTPPPPPPVTTPPASTGRQHTRDI